MNNSKIRLQREKEREKASLQIESTNRCVLIANSLNNRKRLNTKLYLNVDVIYEQRFTKSISGVTSTEAENLRFLYKSSHLKFPLSQREREIKSSS